MTEQDISMNISSLLQTFNYKYDVANADRNQFAVNSVVHIIHNYLLTVAPSFVLTLSCGGNTACNFFYDLVEKLFRSWGAPMFQFVVMHENITAQMTGRRYCNLILVDSYQAFAEIDLISHTQYYNHNEFYHIFLQTWDYLIPTQMQLIFDYCWTNQMINCNVQIMNAQDEILIYTYFPYTSQHCGLAVPILVNQYVGSSLLTKELFPRKLLNLHGCALKAAIWHEPPFLNVATAENGSSRITGGFEGELLQALAAKLNFGIDVHVPPNNEQRGRFINKAYNGALGMLHARTADMSLGVFRHTAQRSANATALVSYYQSAQVVAVLKSAYDLSSMEILLFPFQRAAWLLILVLTITCFLILELVRICFSTQRTLSRVYQPTQQTFLYILLMLVGMSVTRPPNFNFARLFFTVWSAFTLLLRAVYQALIFHVIRTQVTNRMPVDFSELVEQNYTAIMNIATYETLVDVPFLQQLQVISLNTTLQWAAFEYMQRYPQKSAACVTPRDILIYYCRLYEKLGVLKLLPQDVINLQVTMYLTKHSYLIDEFERQIMWLRSAGFIEAWARSSLDYEYFKKDEGQYDHVFKFNNLYMIFVLTSCGLTFAFVVFLLEVLSKRCRVLKYIFLKI